MKLVFLDFDGVLTVPATNFRTASAESIRYLNELTDKTGAKIVVTSTWRLGGFEYVKEILGSWGATGEVIGITPDLTKRNKAIFVDASRGNEICEFLRKMTEQPENFVILDDESDMWPYSGFLILINHEIGFSEIDLEKALAMFS